MTIDHEHRNQVGERLLEIRGQRDQRAFAETVESVQQTISKYERGEIPRSWLFLARLRTEEGVDLNYLLTGRRMRSESGAPRNGGSKGENDRPSEGENGRRLHIAGEH